MFLGGGQWGVCDIFVEKSASKAVFSRRKLQVCAGLLSFVGFSYEFVDFFELL